MIEQENPGGTNQLRENFEDFFETTLCGFVIADTGGIIIRANKKIAGWLHTNIDELKGKRFSDLLSIGGKIYYETHLWPLLRMQGFFDEVVLELSSGTGRKMRVMVNALECRDNEGEPCFIRYKILNPSDRLRYEENLQGEKIFAEKALIKQTELVALREQLIAVLGHDLLNPLSAITMAVELLSSTVSAENEVILQTLKRSTYRMTELINNIMDFARTRLGEGLVLNRRDTLLEPVFQQVVDEIKLVYPKREIRNIFELAEPVNCDPDRMGQLLSNLLANALTHGDADSPVSIHAFLNKGNLEISVCNSGPPIPEHLHEHLFAPFTKEGSRPSQQGLGLGLYICSEIAKAHNATLSFTSNDKQTCFTMTTKIT
jgi:sigma-B regulation protein RsbU (phosphoserine phosphatase)